MRTLIASLLLCLATTAHADYSGIAADGVSSAIASTVPGLSEANPLGLLVFPIKIGIVAHAKTLPAEEGVPLVRGIDSTSWGAAANNICIALTLNPACLLLGVAVGGTLWHRSADERAFFEVCARHKRVYPEDASLNCRYTPPT